MPGSLFDEFQRDIVLIVKPDGRRFENIKANVQPDTIAIYDENIPLEEGDLIYRDIPNGLTEEYVVLDRGFRQKFHDIPGRYLAKVQKNTRFTKEKGMTPEALRNVLAVISRSELVSPNTFVADHIIAQEAGLSIQEVRDYLDLLEGEGKVTSANSFDGHSALLTALGRVFLRDPNYSPLKPMSANTSIYIAGNVSDSILNISSTLHHANQTIETASKLNYDSKEELKALIEELNLILQEAPPESAEEAEAVAESAKDLVEAATKDKPNRARVQITKEGLEKAASNISNVLPKILPVAMDIINRIQLLI